MQSAAFSPAMRRLGDIQCSNLNRELENVNMDLFMDMQKWLRVHGKVGICTFRLSGPSPCHFDPP